MKHLKTSTSAALVAALFFFSIESTCNLTPQQQFSVAVDTAVAVANAGLVAATVAGALPTGDLLSLKSVIGDFATALKTSVAEYQGTDSPAQKATVTGAAIAKAVSEIVGLPANIQFYVTDLLALLNEFASIYGQLQPAGATAHVATAAPTSRMRTLAIKYKAHPKSWPELNGELSDLAAKSSK